jgi:PTH1 family peptidyl-tRNA hydrolase
VPVKIRFPHPSGPHPLVDLTEKSNVKDATAQLEAIQAKLIVGLGNPGKTYLHTRHNIGFMALDALASRLQTSFTNEARWKSHVAKHPHGWLAKPQTYMNLSGQAVLALSKFFKLKPEQILIVHDDVDLPLGTLRLRPSGSAGGQNGMKSIIQSLGTQNFPRLKMGISTQSGRPAGDRLVGHVLGTFTEEEKATLAQVIDRSTEALYTAITQSLGTAMNLFNRKETLS